jgi:hypothetical protein
MKTRFAVLVGIALIGLLLPSSASAAIFTYTCAASVEPAPPDWFGGPWSAPVRVVVDTQARSVELFDQDNIMLATTVRQGRLSGLNDYQMDVTVTENVISWGVIEMWGFSGYIDRQSGRLDLIWSNSGGFSPSTSSRQFHGSCTLR